MDPLSSLSKINDEIDETQKLIEDAVAECATLTVRISETEVNGRRLELERRALASSTGIQEKLLEFSETIEDAAVKKYFAQIALETLRKLSTSEEVSLRFRINTEDQDGISAQQRFKDLTQFLLEQNKALSRLSRKRQEIVKRAETSLDRLTERVNKYGSHTQAESQDGDSNEALNRVPEPTEPQAAPSECENAPGGESPGNNAFVD